jgi:hypothetical protein
MDMRPALPRPAAVAFVAVKIVSAAYDTPEPVDEITSPGSARAIFAWRSRPSRHVPERVLDESNPCAQSPDSRPTRPPP